MKNLWIIYAKYHLKKATYSPRLMSEAATREGIENEVFYSEFFSIMCKDGKEILFYQDKEVTDLPSVAFIRCYNYELMRFLEERGVELVNSYKGMKIVKDKFLTHKMVDKLKIRQPKFLFSVCPNFELLKNQIKVPFVMKDNTGAAGRNVYLVSSAEQMEEVINENKKTKFLFQEYIEASKGKDIRLYVVGTKVVGCVRRVASGDDFRANISLGGRGEDVDVPQALKDEAASIAKELGLQICSVDYLICNNGFLFCEANGNAAFSAFFNLGYNMQKIFMEFIKDKYF